MKVKEALNVLLADYIEVIEIKQDIGGETEIETLYIYSIEDEEAEDWEQVYDENYGEKEVLCIVALRIGAIRITVF